MIFARWTFLPLLLSLKNKDYHDDDDSYDGDFALNDDDDNDYNGDFAADDDADE